MTATTPLDGLVVADFSRVLAGPLASMYLGDLGADVIKVEHPDGDDARRWGPPFVGPDSAYFMSANRNKRSIVLDLSVEENRKAALALVDRADVLMENFRPGTMDRLGLSYEELARRNPRLVYCSISGFGSGEGSRLAGYDFLVQAVGGLMSVTGEPDGPPMKVGVALVDVITGLHALIGVLAALHERRRTGRGQHVEVNLLSSLLASLVNQASTYLATGEVPVADGNRHPSIAPYESLTVGERQLAVAVGNDRQFRELARIAGAPELADDARFASNPARVDNRDELQERLEALLADRDVDELTAQLSAAGVPAGPVNDVAEAFKLATLLGLEPVVRIPSDARGEHPHVASPLSFSASAVSYRLPPPRLGEHTEVVLRWLQG
ncbi:CaiB/BaiF CoA transferase family protein [Phytohabitans suffuscus]|uniref:CoA transferase n=1 Tax=Phytohabitans suffuscus TaxID=624315 RepID=A0A6F8YVN2_9ACTN|nr:CoA transferase [Phytohabitans suffuscus]BCB89911.1 CoA transferase [Phytohabitans suffuscus]